MDEDVWVNGNINNKKKKQQLTSVSRSHGDVRAATTSSVSHQPSTPQLFTASLCAAVGDEQVSRSTTFGELICSGAGWHEHREGSRAKIFGLANSLTPPPFLSLPLTFPSPVSHVSLSLPSAAL